jgi:hypothetical protein
MLMLGLILGFFAAPARADAPTANAAVVQGIVRSPDGVPVPGVKVSAAGPISATVFSDSAGMFTLSLPQGIYRIEATKGGFVPAVLNDIAILAGQTLPLTVSLTRADLSSLRTIGSVTVARGSSINTGAAAQAYVSAQAVTDLANPQINDVLQQVPDLNVQHMGSQPDTSIVLAGSQPYETQVLIDGHPIALGQYGVWLSEYFSSFLIGGAEVQSGPGNTTPFANTAVGGTVNLLTPGYTTQPMTSVVIGTDNYLSQYSNALTTGSLGKLAYVAGAGYGSSNGPYYQNSKCVVIPNNPANDNTPQSVGIVDFCGDSSGSLFTKGEVFKLRYEFSPSTSIEAGFVGSQGGFLPQGTSYGQYLGGTKIVECLPSAPLSCSNPSFSDVVGKTISAYTWYPGSNVFSNQPIFTGQFRTSLADTTLLVRPYAGNIEAIVDGSQENQFPLFFSPPGTVPSYPPGTPIPPNPNQNAFEMYCNTDNYLGQIASPKNTTTVVDGREECWQAPFSEYEQDRLYGTTVSLLRPLGQSLLDFTYDFHGIQTFAYYNVPSDIAVPDTTERYATFSLTGDLHVVPNLGLDAGLYDTTWKLVGTQAIGQTSNLEPLNRTLSHFDPHLALVFQPRPGLSYRFAWGTSETYPFAGQVSGLPFSTPPSATAPTGLFTEKNPFLLPETSSEFSAGLDKRFRGGGVLSLDLQATLIHNVFETLTLPGTGVATEAIIEPVNVARLRAQLATLRYSYAPLFGLGYNIGLTADRSIVDGLPQAFYASTTPGAGALPANNQQICGTGLSTPGIPVCIPYLKGYGAVTYRWHDATYLKLGVDYEGKNNSYYQPPFALVDLTARHPLNSNLEMQISVENLLNTNNFANLPAPNLGVPVVTEDATGLTSNPSALIPALPRTVRAQLRLHTGHS